MQFRDLPFGKRDDGDAGKLQMLVERRHVRLIATDAVQCFGYDDSELATLGITDKPLNTTPQDRTGSRYGRILIGSGDLPAFPEGMLTAKPELVLYRCLTLLVVGIASIKRGADHGKPP